VLLENKIFREETCNIEWATSCALKASAVDGVNTRLIGIHCHGVRNWASISQSSISTVLTWKVRETRLNHVASSSHPLHVRNSKTVKVCVFTQFDRFGHRQEWTMADWIFWSEFRQNGRWKCNVSNNRYAGGWLSRIARWVPKSSKELQKIESRLCRTWLPKDDWLRSMLVRTTL